MNTIRSLKILMVLSASIVFLGASVLSYAQPKISKEAIPKKPSSYVSKQIKRLYSSDALERGNAAYALGQMGEKAAPAIPFLIGVLHDQTTLQWFPHHFLTSPGQEATKALGKIGEPAVEPLINALIYGDSGVQRRGAANALRQIGDARAVEPLIAALKDEALPVRGKAADALESITKQDFGEDQAKWQQWWDENKNEIFHGR